MIPAGWRYASATVVGSSHTKTNTPCQDSHRCGVVLTDSDTSFLVAVVSDGAGSASNSLEGARLACDLFYERSQDKLRESGISCINRESVEGWITDFQNSVKELADAAQLATREYACTLLGAVVGIDDSVFFQVGDGSIVVSETLEHEYTWVFWPDRGEYANTTFFITEETANQNLHFESKVGSIWQLALLSDGLQGLALHYASQAVHAPFFDEMFAALRKEPEGPSSKLSTQLEQFLSSERVNERTDDDKTLILASRT